MTFLSKGYRSLKKIGGNLQKGGNRFLHDVNKGIYTVGKNINKAHDVYRHVKHGIEDAADRIGAKEFVKEGFDLLEASPLGLEVNAVRKNALQLLNKGRTLSQLGDNLINPSTYKKFVTS